MSGVIYIQKRNTQSLFVESMLVNQYALMNNISYKYFKRISELSKEEIENSLLIEGSVNTIQEALLKIERKAPEPDYYPKNLSSFLNRKVWKTTLAEAKKELKEKPLFIKSHNWKEMTGISLLPFQSDSLNNYPKDMLVWCSEPVSFIAEWRIYILNNKILACCRYDYSEEEELYLNMDVINEAIKINSLTKKQKAYVFDWGLTNKNETILVENNDAWAIGAYGGINYKDYTNLLISRWEELKQNI